MATSRRLSLVSFDAFSTLLKPAGGVGAQYAAAAQRLAGLSLDPNLLQTRFLEEIRTHRTMYPNYGYAHNMSTRDWWIDVVQNTFRGALTSLGGELDDGTLNDVAAHLFKNFDCELYPYAYQLLRHLKDERGLRLCVISNSDERLSDFLRHQGVADFFDLILTSRQVGVEKPDPAIFRRAFAHFGNGGSGVGALPNETLHIGDDMVCDFEGAKRVGMRAIIVDHRRKTPRNSYVCHDLKELKEKIDDIIDTERDRL